MKQILLPFLTALLFCGCQTIGSENAYSDKFTHTGCASDTKSGMYGATPRLTFKHAGEGVAIICSDVEMNCVIKTVGISSKQSVNGNTIHYDIYVDSEISANCMCLVHEMTTMVTGLKEGREYTLDLTIEGLRYNPIDFTYKSGLNKTVDLDLYRPDPVIVQ